NVVPVKPGGSAVDVPLIVLIDEGSASSSEIFAGAIQDYKRAKLVGTRTIGTGTVLQPFELSDGSEILLAVLEWYTPKRRHIWHKGTRPAREVRRPAGAALLPPEAEGQLTAAALRRSEDEQLLMALDLLRDQLRKAEKKKN